MRSSFILLLAAAFSLANLAGCASRAAQQRAEGEESERVIEMEPMVIVASSGEDGPTVAMAELTDVFNEANDYYRAEDYERAVERYELVLRSTDDPSWQRIALFNLGLAQESLGRCEQAVAAFEDVIGLAPASEDALDAIFHVAECHANRGEFQLVPPLMERARRHRFLTLQREAEASLREGTALYEMRRFAAAEDALSWVLEINEAAERARASGDESASPLGAGHPIIAQSKFMLGSVYHQLFSEIRMVLPLERYRRDLEDKQRLFEQAHDWYIEAIRTGNVLWAPAAGHMVAKLYEDYYFDILASEVPETFGELELEIYFEELRAFIQPGLDRAMNLYERALAMAYRLGNQTTWVDETLEAIERLQNYANNEELWEEEHQLIVENRHPRSARVLDDMVFRDDLRSRGDRSELR